MKSTKRYEITLKYKDVASILGITLGSLRTRLSRNSFTLTQDPVNDFKVLARLYIAKQLKEQSDNGTSSSTTDPQADPEDCR